MNTQVDTSKLPLRHCQNGESEVCLAANLNEPGALPVVCPFDSCDIDDGVRCEEWKGYNERRTQNNI
jgi:hypothetical protein